MNEIVRKLRALDARLRHAEARHPVRYSVCHLAFIYLIIWAPTTLISNGPWGMSGELLLFYAALTGMLVLFEAYSWRPNGGKRRRYERWVERREQQDSATGWFADPTGRHRVRYMKQTKWTQWVADGSDAFEDRGAVTRDFLGPGAASVRSRRARPLLLGFVVGGVLGIVLIVPALLFPHTRAIAFISAANTHPVSSTWWAIGVAIVLAGAARALFAARARLDVSADDATDTKPVRHDQAIAFLHSFVPTIAIAATAAWGTWIQNGLMMPFPIFSFAALAGCFAVALIAAVFAVRVSRVEHARHADLRARGLLPALRGAFVATTTA